MSRQPPNYRTGAQGKECGDCDFCRIYRDSVACDRFLTTVWVGMQCDEWQMNGSNLPRQTKDQPRW